MGFTAEAITFFVFALMGITGAVLMINLTHVMHMAVALGFTFFSIAGLYLLLDADFLAVIQILIYTGAITILMIFGIMLTKHREEDQEKRRPLYHGLCFLGIAGFFVITMSSIVPIPQMAPLERVQTSVAQLAEVVFGHYVIPFEVVSLLLLVALIGAVVLAKKEENS